MRQGVNWRWRPSDLLADGSSLQVPARTVPAMEISVRLSSIGTLNGCRVPLKLFADPISDVAQVVGFRQPPGIFEVASCGRPSLAGFQPLCVMPNRARYGRRGRLKALELLFRQKQPPLVISEQHSAISYE